jgi:hypothetical protein
MSGRIIPPCPAPFKGEDGRLNVGLLYSLVMTMP